MTNNSTIQIFDTFVNMNPTLGGKTATTGTGGVGGSISVGGAPGGTATSGTAGVGGSYNITGGLGGFATTTPGVGGVGGVLIQQISDVHLSSGHIIFGFNIVLSGQGNL